MTHNFVVGDVVVVGDNGKVQYTVTAINADGTLELQGEKSRRKGVDGGKLRMIEAYNALVTPGAATPVVREQFKDMKGYVLVVDGFVQRAFKSFEAAAFTLSRLKGTYHVACIAKGGKVLVERVSV